MALRMTFLRRNLFKGVKIGFIGLLVVNICSYNPVLFNIHPGLSHQDSLPVHDGRAQHQQVPGEVRHAGDLQDPSG